MKKKPAGAKYRNLTARGGVIYVERVTDGKRVRFSTESDDWDQAAAVRDLYDERNKQREAEAARAPLPSLREFVPRYMAGDLTYQKLAPTTKRDRNSVLGEDGPLLKHLGDLQLDAITAPVLREWWAKEVIARGLQTRTGRGYVDALSSLATSAFRWAIRSPPSASSSGVATGRRRPAPRPRAVVRCAPSARSRRSAA